jgi:MGT family glycosyltransferase
MPHVLAFTLPMSGHLFPFVPVLAELRRRQWSVTLAVPGSRPMPELPDMRTVHLPWPDADPLGPRSDQPRFAPYPQVEIFARYGEGLSRALEEVIAHERPTFVLVDTMLWGGMIAAEASRIPWGTVTHNPLCFRGLGIDARGPALPPPNTWVSRLRHQVVENAMRCETEVHLKEVNTVRQRRGLAPLARLVDLLTAVPLILATTSEPFEYPRHDWPASLRFVGPMIWDAPYTDTPPMDLADDGRPLILVADSTVTSTSAASRWTEKVFEALADEPYRIVATVPTGPAAQVDPLNPMKVERSLSHSTLLPHVSCVVCHGGAGIVQKALWFGVPVVAIPSAFDRFEVARRLEVCGAGVRLTPDRLTLSNIKSAVRQALTLKPNAEFIGKRFRESGGASVAADAIETLPSSG